MKQILAAIGQDNSQPKVPLPMPTYHTVCFGSTELSIGKVLVAVFDTPVDENTRQRLTDRFGVLYRIAVHSDTASFPRVSNGEMPPLMEKLVTQALAECNVAGETHLEFTKLALGCY